jgi:hypothetical protein
MYVQADQFWRYSNSSTTGNIKALNLKVEDVECTGIDIIVPYCISTSRPALQSIWSSLQWALKVISSDIKQLIYKMITPLSLEPKLKNAFS